MAGRGRYAKIPFDLEKVKEMVDKGAGKRDVADEYDCSESAVEHFCKKHGIQISTKYMTDTERDFLLLSNAKYAKPKDKTTPIVVVRGKRYRDVTNLI